MPSHPRADDAIEAAIRKAESETSAEIRVFITRHAPDAQAAGAEARRHFERLGMSRTPLRNAVLFFLAPASRQLAIASDESVRFRLGATFPDAIHRAAGPWMSSDPQKALLEAIREAAGMLSRHFPRSHFDRDDFSNAVLRD